MLSRKGFESLRLQNGRQVLTEIWFDGYVRSNTDDSDSDILRDHRLRPARRCYGWTQEEAIRYAIEAAKSLREPLDGKPSEWPERPLATDLPYALFEDIDDVLFGGTLKGNVLLLCDQNLPPGLIGTTIRPRKGHYERVTVKLSKNVLADSNPSGIVEALIHQMIHAYLLQCCGYKKRNDGGPGHDLHHGSDFSTIAYIIVNVCPELQEFTAFPASMGTSASDRRANTLSRVGISPDTYPAIFLEEDSSACNTMGMAAQACRSIFEHVKRNTAPPPLDFDDHPLDKEGNKRPLAQYFHTFSNGKFKHSVRNSLCDSPAAHAELHYKNRAIPVPYSAFPTNSAISRKRPPVILKIPFVDDAAFEDMHSFLTSGRYGTPVNSTRGPPRLLDCSESSEAVVLADVRAYRLGAVLDIAHLRQYAMDRLWSRETMSEDPVRMLEYLYHGPPKEKKQTCIAKCEEINKLLEGGGRSCRRCSRKEYKPDPPDSALRDWALAWMASRHAGYASNIGALRNHAGFADRWRQLRERGGPLVTDSDNAVKAAPQIPAVAVPAVPVLRSPAGPTLAERAGWNMEDVRDELLRTQIMGGGNAIVGVGDGLVGGNYYGLPRHSSMMPEALIRQYRIGL